MGILGCAQSLPGRFQTQGNLTCEQVSFGDRHGVDDAPLRCRIRVSVQARLRVSVRLRFQLPTSSAGQYERGLAIWVPPQHNHSRRRGAVAELAVCARRLGGGWTRAGITGWSRSRGSRRFAPWAKSTRRAAKFGMGERPSERPRGNMQARPSPWGPQGACALGWERGAASGWGQGPPTALRTHSRAGNPT